MDVFDLSAKISLDTSEYESGLNQASENTSSFGDKLKGGLGTAAKIGAGAVGVVSTAAGVLGGVFTKTAGDVASYGDNIDKASQKMGISAEAYQEWDAVLQHSGANIGSLKRGMTTLAKATETSSEEFEKLGISQEELAGMSQEELFSRTIEGLQNMGEGTERTILAQKLLGGSAKELGALLNTSAEDTQAMKDRVHELGGVMSDEAVKASAAYQDSLQDFQTAMQGIKMNMVSEFLPSVTTIMDGLQEIFAGNADEGAQMITQGVDDLLANLDQAIPKMLEVGGKILGALFDAIIDNLPKIMESGTKIILKLVEAIIEHLPEIIETGIEIILILTEGILNALPDLITKLVEAIVASLPLLIEGGIRLIIALVQHLPEIIMALINAVPQIIQAIIDAFAPLVSDLGDVFKRAWEHIKENAKTAFTDIWNKIKEALHIDDAIQWGKDLIDNFIGGIWKKAQDLWDTISNIAGGIGDFIGFSEPKKGPLSNFHTFAPDMMELFAKGIKDNERLITDQIGKSFDFGEDIVPTDAGMQTATRQSGFGAGIGSMVVNIYATEHQNVRELSQEVIRQINKELKSKRLVYA